MCTIYTHSNTPHLTTPYTTNVQCVCYFIIFFPLLLFLFCCCCYFGYTDCMNNVLLCCSLCSMYAYIEMFRLLSLLIRSCIHSSVHTTRILFRYMPFPYTRMHTQAQYTNRFSRQNLSVCVCLRVCQCMLETKPLLVCICVYLFIYLTFSAKLRRHKSPIGVTTLLLLLCSVHIAFNCRLSENNE